MIPYQITGLKLLVAHRALMLTIHDLRDAVFAERVATLRDVGVIKRVEADDALSKLSNYIVNADLNSLIVLAALALLQTWRLLLAQHWLVFDHFCVIVVSNAGFSYVTRV